MARDLSVMSTRRSLTLEVAFRCNRVEHPGGLELDGASKPVRSRDRWTKARAWRARAWKGGRPSRGHSTPGALGAAGLAAILCALATPAEAGLIRSSPSSRWPDGVVPYQLAPDLDPNTESTFLAAADRWEQNTSLDFVDRSSDPLQYPDYLLVENGPGCSTFIGRVGGEQAMSLSNQCNLAAVIHQIGHTLGLYHEHQRPDRDTYVQVLFENIQSGAVANYNIVTNAEVIGPYDFESIMHYRGFEFSIRGQPTIVPINPPTATLGGTSVSAGDIATIAVAYDGADPFCTSDSDCQDGLFCNGTESCDIGSGQCTSTGVPAPECQQATVAHGCLGETFDVALRSVGMPDPVEVSVEDVTLTETSAWLTPPDALAQSLLNSGLLPRADVSGTLPGSVRLILTSSNAFPAIRDVQGFGMFSFDVNDPNPIIPGDEQASFTGPALVFFPDTAWDPGEEAPVVLSEALIEFDFSGVGASCPTTTGTPVAFATIAGIQTIPALPAAALAACVVLMSAAGLVLLRRRSAGEQPTAGRGGR